MKKKLFIITPIVICILVFLGVYLYFNYEDRDTSLTISEKKWIASNSLTKVNLDVLNDYAVLGNNGTGVLFDFINNFELETDLEFNKIAYSKNGNPTSNELQFRVVNSDIVLTDKDLLLYEDGYILLSSDSIRYNDISSIKSKSIGLIKTDAAEVAYYLKTATDITYKPYDDIDALILALNNKEVDMIIIPQMMYLDKTIKLEGTNINYYFAEFTKKIVLTLSSDNKNLNSIVRKYFNNWKEKNYVSSYNNQYLNYYITVNEISDKVKADMLSKSYVYGYVENKPYEVLLDKKVLGIAGEYIDRIQRLTGVDIIYKKYNKVEDLNRAIQNGDVDFYFNYTGNVNGNYTSTISPFIEEYVVLSNPKNGSVITSFESLKNQKANIIQNNLLYNYIRDNSKASLNPVNKLDDLLTKNNLIIIDKEVYNYYKHTKFKDYEVVYNDYANIDYRFEIKSTNGDFYKLFNYIIGTNSYYNYRNFGLASLDVSIIDRASFMEFYLIILGLVLIPVLIIVLIYLFAKKKKQVKLVKKEDRRKYTDMLTSLKTRNYLNMNIESWDNSKVYPKSVIIVDLNNVSYVNETEGHEEGDKLIIKAASILVNNQLEKSEIIRIDGNEFLIYLVGYSEKQIDTYTKKLAKELKDLPHGFGAAVGYSVITNEVKSIDDAINEASLAMKAKKEELR